MLTLLAMPLLCSSPLGRSRGFKGHRVASRSPLGIRDAAMPSGHVERYDFFLSRRGSVAAVL
jgi:hypothetical protein